jgi:hypothetical protein
MKVHIHQRREWRQPGKATGIIRYRLALPANDYQLTARLRPPAKGLGIVATFARRQLAVSEELRRGGSFTVDVEVRAANLGARWKRLVRWVPGEDLELLLRQAGTLWADWPKEIAQDRDEKDVEMDEAIARLRGGPPQKS